MTELRCDGPRDSPLRLILAHGAGAGMDSPFMREFALGLAELGVYVVRFEFPYMARRRVALMAGARRPQPPVSAALRTKAAPARRAALRTKAAPARRAALRSPPDRSPVLLETFRDVVAAVGQPEHTCIGGKSMGGRIASMLADELGVRGLVCLGYPFHPPDQPDKLRTSHLVELRTPTLIIQGSRDSFGSQAEIAGYPLSRAIELVFLNDGDHSWKPRRASGHTATQHFQAGLQAVEHFLRVRAARG